MNPNEANFFLKYIVYDIVIHISMPFKNLWYSFIWPSYHCPLLLGLCAMTTRASFSCVIFHNHNIHPLNAVRVHIYGIKTNSLLRLQMSFIGFVLNTIRHYKRWPGDFPEHMSHSIKFQYFWCKASIKISQRQFQWDTELSKLIIISDNFVIAG